MARSVAEKHTHAEECTGLQKELSRVGENNKRLEQDVSKLKAYAIKRAQNKASSGPTHAWQFWDMYRIVQAHDAFTRIMKGRQGQPK